MINVTSVVNKFNGNELDNSGEIIVGGDLTLHEITFTENIFFDSRQNQTDYVFQSVSDFALKKLFCSNFRMLNGFQVGQNVELIRTGSDGSTTTVTTTVTDLNYSENSISFNDFFTDYVAFGNIPIPGQNYFTLQVYSTDLRTNFFFNLSFNVRNYPYIYNKTVSNQLGSFINSVVELRKSPVDNTNLRFWAGIDTSSMTVGDDIDCEQLGFLSGSGVVLVNLERLTDINSYTRQWKITVELINPAFLLENLNEDIGGVFQQRLVLYSDIEYYSNAAIIANPNVTEQPTVLQHDLAFISFFNDQFGGNQSTLVTSIPNTEFLYYNGESQEFTVVVNSPTISEIYIGGAYIPQDKNYYKIKDVSQDRLCMLIQTTELTSSPSSYILSSLTNPDNAQWEIEITSYTYAANNHTISFIVRPSNQEFEDFIAGREFLDRVFYIWLKIGNKSYLIYDKFIIEEPKESKLLDDFAQSGSNWALLRNDNINKFYVIDDSWTGSFVSKPTISTEDNLALTFNLAVPRNIRYSDFTSQIIFANKNDLTEFFAFETHQIDLTDNIYNEVTGKTVFTETLSNTYNIQNSNFNNIRLRNEPSWDTFTLQGLRVTIPFQSNWRYWLTQNNVFSFLAANGLNTKNFESYHDYDFTNYGFFLKNSLESETFEALHYTPLFDILDYDETFTTTDEEWQGSTSIVYKIASSGQVVPNLIINQLMLIEITVNTGIALADYWGQLTVEKLESNTRWAISTNYNNAPENIENPLLPEAGQTRLKKTLINSNEVVYSCLIDTTRLYGDEFKITLKHWNLNTKIEQVRSKFLTEKTYFPTDLDITESDVLKLDCCEIYNVYARTENNSIEFNDTTLILAKYNSNYSTFNFELQDENDNTLDLLTISTSINNTTDKYHLLEWQQVLNDYGIGCYKVKIEIDGTYYLYGIYNLQLWSLENVENTVKLHTQFDSIISIPEFKNINNIVTFDFRNMTVYDSIRFNGFIGERDPKTIIDNIILSNRTVQKTYRENLYEYLIKTDPVTKYISRKLLDFHFLNENQIIVWDYNDFNHEFYNFKTMIVKEILKPEYKEISNKAVIQCVLGDKQLLNKSGF